MTKYFALIRKETDSDFGVEFPDFPGCVTAGRSLDEAHAMAAEALALHMDGLREDGQPLPEPGSLETILADRENAGAAVIVVPAPRARSRAVRLNITVDETLLESIDAAAGPGQRSAFLATAAAEKLGFHEKSEPFKSATKVTRPSAKRPAKKRSVKRSAPHRKKRA